MGVEGEIRVIMSLATVTRFAGGTSMKLDQVVLVARGRAIDEETGRDCAYFPESVDPRVTASVPGCRVFKSKDTGEWEIGVPLDTQHARIIPQSK